MGWVLLNHRPDARNIHSQLEELVRDMKARLEDEQVLEQCQPPSARDLPKEHLRALRQQVQQHQKLWKRCDEWLKAQDRPTPKYEDGHLKGESKFSMFGFTIHFAFEDAKIIDLEKFKRYLRCNNQGNRVKHQLCCMVPKEKDELSMIKPSDRLSSAPWVQGVDAVEKQVAEHRKLVKLIGERPDLNVGVKKQQKFVDLIEFAETHEVIDKQKADDLRLVNDKGNACKHDQAGWEQKLNTKMDSVLADVKNMVEQQDQRTKRSASMASNQHG